MQVKEICDLLESVAPLSYQESYDNAGLIVGEKKWEVSKILLSLDCTEDIVDEAIENGANMVVCHHPIVFKGLKKFNGTDYVQRTVIKAIKNDIAIYAAHTNLDKVLRHGVSEKLAQKLGLQNLTILSPEKERLVKLQVYVPKTHMGFVKQSLFLAGAGEIGAYSNCSFSVEGKGSFKPSEGSSPYIGKLGKEELVEEEALTVLVEKAKLNAVISALLASHPYEEPAYDIYTLENVHKEVGLGVIGDLKEPMKTGAFLEHLKHSLALEVVRHTNFSGSINRVAVCGGSGAFLIKTARHCNADAYVTADVKYHEFFDAEKELLLADVGHYESEYSTLEVFHDIIKEKFPTFAILFTDRVTNPVNYFK